MLNPFPQLLVYGFFAPALLRVTVAIVFFCMSLHFMRARKQMAGTPAPFIGKPGVALVIFSALVYLALGLTLFFGWETQIAALIGILASLKSIWLARTWKAWAPYARSTYILIAVICFSLVLTGAGALAMDLPL